ncbi:MAG TPA: DUF2628 domain-containing protein [Methylovirgula sp.]|nr:DUF2628 domain-containing protein [Methylovirgula sp.]
MAVYTVHLPGRGASPGSLVHAVFVPEGFSRAAFFLGPLWLAWNRLWLEFFAWIVAFLLLASGAIPYISSGTAFFIALLLEILLGLEANNLRRGDFARRGFRLIDVAAGATRDDAERGFYRRACAPAPAASDEKPPPLPAVPPGAQPDVLGVFPLPEDPR